MERGVADMKASEILNSNAQTFEDKGKEYGHSYKEFGKVAEAIFPDGVMFQGDVSVIKKWNATGIYFMMIHKMMRIASTGFQSIDSMKDLSIYSAMLEEVMGGE